jgi:acetyl esterase/lipase
MKKILYALSFLFITAQISVAQYDCSSNRFKDLDFFSSWDETTAVLFGSGPAVGSGQTQELKMDIYEPQGDTMSKRPLILIAFGGSFISGAREDVADLCKLFSKLGYVAATIDYRVGFFVPDQVTTTQAVMRGMHDMRAAVRFFYKDAQTSNTFKVDTNFFFHNHFFILNLYFLNQRPSEL